MDYHVEIQVIFNRGVTQSLRQGGGRNMFVRMNLSLKYSQKRNFFEQKKTKFSKAGGVDASPPRIYAPDLQRFVDSTEVHFEKKLLTLHQYSLMMNDFVYVHDNRF